MKTRGILLAGFCFLELLGPGLFTSIGVQAMDVSGQASQGEHCQSSEPSGGNGFPTKAEEQAAMSWLKENHLNPYGDPADVNVYAGGTPLFDETTGQSYTLYEYLVKKFPDKPWNH